MGIKVNVGELVVPARMREKLVFIMATELAPVVGEFLVRQIAYTHDVQGRNEDDQHGVWPPRKVPTSGVVVFSQRAELKQAITQMLKDQARGVDRTYQIKQQRIEQDSFTGTAPRGQMGTFTKRQLLGAKLALDQEKKNAVRKRELKQQIQEEFAKGTPDADTLARLKMEERSVPRKITSLKSARNSMKYRARPALFQTGTLRDSWNWKVIAEGRKAVLYIGTSIEYARVHFDGSAKKNIPVRKEFVLTRKDREMIKQFTTEVVGNAFGQLFWRR